MISILLDIFIFILCDLRLGLSILLAAFMPQSPLPIPPSALFWAWRSLGLWDLVSPDLHAHSSANSDCFGSVPSATYSLSTFLVLTQFLLNDIRQRLHFMLPSHPFPYILPFLLFLPSFPRSSFSSFPFCVSGFCVCSGGGSVSSQERGLAREDHS